MIELVNLCKVYKAKNHKKTKALNNISLTLPDSGMVFVIGKSGSGKSTLLNLLGGLDDITTGDIIVNGNSLSKFNVDDFANYRSTYIGFIFQDYHILDEFTVKENIELSADISNINCDTAECLRLVDLEGYEERYPKELSGGQQQRVAIARALAKDSKIILADEPTGNLDTKTTKQVLTILKEISKTRLVVIVSHNLDDASEYADRIISLDHGCVVSDLSRVDEYFNEFKIENNKLFLPHNHDLKKEELKLIIENKNDYSEIVQINDGMIKTTFIENNKKFEKLNKSKLSNEKFKKIFNLIFKRRIWSKVLTIFIVSVLISLFYIFQIFNAFDETYQLIDNVNDNNEAAVIIKKDKYQNAESQYCAFPISDEDYQTFNSQVYNGNVYKLYNSGIDILTHYISTFVYKDAYEIAKSFYVTETFGTLNCNEEFLTKIYGKDGKLDVVGDMYSTEYGIVITDYVADGIMYFEKFNRNNIESYEDLIGFYGLSETKKQVYINAVVNTGYKDRYSELISLYSRLWDRDPSNDNVFDEIKSHPDYPKFANEVQKFLGINYNFSPNYAKYIHTSTTINSAMMSIVDLKYKTTNLTIDINFARCGYINEEITGNNAKLSYLTYNMMFGTDYTKDNLDEFVPHEITFRKRLADQDYYEETFIIEELVVSPVQTIYISEEKFVEFLEYKFVPYALYLDSPSEALSISKLIDENDFYVLSNDTKGISMVNRAVLIFGKFLNLIAMLFLLVCVIYLVNFGYKSIKSNLYEIGIITALGCDNNSMGKLFVFEILSVGIGILVISFVGMFLGARLSNEVLISSFEFVFNCQLTSVEIVPFNLSYVVIDLILAVVIVVISALFPLIFIRKIKPVNILKAKE